MLKDLTYPTQWKNVWEIADSSKLTTFKPITFIDCPRQYHYNKQKGGKRKMDIYLTNEEYFDLLVRGRKHLDSIKELEFEDSDHLGDKYTVSNCGLCNDSLTTKDIALFPKNFPHRTTMKYRKPHHKCPLDEKKERSSQGCFYSCLGFNKKVKTVNDVKVLFDERIEELSKTAS